MLTKGLQVLHGYVLWESPQQAAGCGIVPLQFWNRLKAEAQRQHLEAELMAEVRLVQVRLDDGRMAFAQRGEAYTAEVRLFERWVNRLGFAVPAGHYSGQRLWPWTRGWTEDLIDTYLARPARPTEAA